MEVLTAAIRVATIKLGYKELKPSQELAVRSLVDGRDVFVSLPTGSGKSLCNTLSTILTWSQLLFELK